MPIPPPSDLDRTWEPEDCYERWVIAPPIESFQAWIRRAVHAEQRAERAESQLRKLLAMHNQDMACVVRWEDAWNEVRGVLS